MMDNIGRVDSRGAMAKRGRANGGPAETEDGPVITPLKTPEFLRKLNRNDDQIAADNAKAATSSTALPKKPVNTDLTSSDLAGINRDDALPPAHAAVAAPQEAALGSGSWKGNRADLKGQGYMEASGKGALSARKGKNADGTYFDNDAAWSGIRSRQNDRDKRAALMASGNEREAEANRFNAMEKDRYNNRSIAQRVNDLRSGNTTWSMKDKDIQAMAAAEFAAQSHRNDIDTNDATARRGQDETTEWRKQQSTDALEGRKFQAEQGRLGREAVTSEGALNRADAAKARSEDLRYKVNAESEAKANEVIKEAGVSAEKAGKDPEEAMYRMQAQLGRGTYKKGALAKKDTSRFWQSDNSEPEVPYSYTPNRAKTASAGKDRPGLKYLGVGDKGEMVYLNAKGEQVTD